MARRMEPAVVEKQVSSLHRPAIMMEEVERRGAEIASGKVKPIKGEVFLKRIRQIRKEIS